MFGWMWNNILNYLIIKVLNFSAPSLSLQWTHLKLLQVYPLGLFWEFHEERIRGGNLVGRGTGEPVLKFCSHFKCSFLLRLHAYLQRHGFIRDEEGAKTPHDFVLFIRSFKYPDVTAVNPSLRSTHRTILRCIIWKIIMTPITITVHMINRLVINGILS